MSPRAPRLSREEILITAIALIDTDGLTQLTMRRLGAALDAEAMAVYRYFPSRHDLLDAIVEHLVTQTATDPASQWQPGDDWRDYVHRIAHGVRQMALAHPRVFPLVATHPTQAPWIRPPLRSLQWVDGFLEGLQDHHFPPAAAVEVYKHFCTFLLGHLLLEVAGLGLEATDDLTGPPTTTDRDARRAQQIRTSDATKAAHTTTDPALTADKIAAASEGRTTTTADEPAVQAAHINDDTHGAIDDTDAVGTDADVPVVAAVVSTRTLDLSHYPNVSALAGLLANNTAANEFDQHLGWLLDAMTTLQRP